MDCTDPEGGTGRMMVAVVPASLLALGVRRNECLPFLKALRWRADGWCP